MVNAQLISYLKVGVSRGFKLEDLKYNLIQAGWPASAVHTAAQEMGNAPSKSKKPVNSVSDYSTTNKKSKIKIPLVINIISILTYISAAILLIFPLGVLFASTLFGPLGVLLAPYSIFLFGITVPFALLFFFMARGLRKGKNGWRIFVIIFYVLSMISLISGLVYSFNLYILVSLLIDTYFVGYLLFSKRSKEFFRKK